ncbi:EAL domain-containing protein [Cohaesibacter intestini]|uniref:EAL domain-containing protein n=1 Tax=Cohaesibacter intestini TaxID=2211145 RepID=UPI000DE9C8D4|nr:EAL domain-containing protein [Cohaesibacter intestini]
MKKVTFSRILILVVIFVGCSFAANSGLLYYPSQFLAEKRMMLDKQPTSGAIVLLEIDNKSLTAIGLWPWKRSIYGQIVEKAFASGAEEIAFDIDFSASSSEKEDREFQQALENASGPVTLAIFQQNSISNNREATLQTNRPISRLEDNAWLATVNVLADPDGVIRHFPFAQEIDGEYVPSLTSVLGGVQHVIPSTFLVDYGIDPDTIPTYSVIDLLEGKLPQDALRGKKLLIGAGAAELRDTLTVPIYGMISGPKMQVLAAENILQGRSLGYAPKSWTVGLTVLLLGMSILVNIRRSWNTYSKIGVLTVLSLGIEALGAWIYFNQPLILRTGLPQTQLALSAAALVLFEIRFKDLMLTLSKRRADSISRLLQTIVTDSFSGILIVDQAGYIREISQQADASFKALGHDIDRNTTIEKQLPTIFQTLIKDCLQNPDLYDHDQTLKTLLVNQGDETRYYEYSLTPSRITAETDGTHERIQVATMLFHDVTATKQEQMRLAYLADHDQLTDLLNKPGFCNELDERMISIIEQDALIFACQCPQIDKVTQSLGAEYSDLLMRHMGERFAQLDAFDLVGCSEQKEFLIAKVGATERDLVALSDVIFECLDQPFDVRGHRIIASCHVGVADFEQSGLLAEEVANAAIVALYRSKETGDRQLFYTAELAADVVHRRLLEREIIDATDRKEFELHYQPQVKLKSEDVVGCEALIRWRHRELGVVRPDLFIPIVEETGMIVELGRWILEQACKDAMTWPKPITVAVNISPVQFIRSDIRADIQHALTISGLPKERLHIEITESLFIADPEPVIETLNAIRADGIKIALDDFGTGYSSLSYIHRFPLDKLKIDRAFVKDLPHSTDSMAVINAVTALADGLGMDVIAEGMETAEQAEVLKIARCNIGQGYYFGKPMSQTDFTAYLNESNRSEGIPGLKKSA